MTLTLSLRERGLLAGVLALAALALFGPALAQHPHYHSFADQAVRLGVPHAMDVLSNLAFAAVGGWGLVRLAQSPLDPVRRALATLACAGLLLTAAGSSWYHWRPDDAGLLVDRLSMVSAFAGLLGLAACRVSRRAGVALAALVLAAAPLTLWVFAASGNLGPWAVLQGGGLVVLLAIAALQADGDLPVRWGWVVLAYALAKVFELGDHAIWEATGEWVSGHSLKHLVAAIAVLPVICAWHPRRVEHNRPVQPQPAA